MFQKMRFQTKLFLTVSVLITVLLIASAMVLDQILLQNTRQTWDAANRQVFNSLLVAMQNHMEEMDEVTKNVHAAQVIQNAYRDITAGTSSNYFDTHPQARDQVFGALYTALGSRPLNGQLTVVSRFGDYVYADNSAGDIELRADQTTGLATVQWGLETDQYKRAFLPDTDPWHAAHEQMITLVRPLRDSYKTLGAIVYSQPITLLDTLCEDFLADTDTYIALIDQNNQLIYEYSPSNVPIALSDWYDSEKQAQGGRYDKGHMRIVIEPLDDTGWSLAQVRGLGTLSEQIRRVRMVLTLSYLVALICVLLMTNLLMRRLTVPLRRLRSQVDDISLDGSLLMCQTNENDEINALSDAISEMVTRFRTQNEHLLLARERDMQSSLNAMEAQLNSHFLYNTLAVIGAVGQMEGSATTPRLCAKLASLLRYSVDFNFKCVTLRDELNNVRDYLDIMAMRHTGQTDFVWELDPNAEQIEVPKLILQPIVENCFKHGFGNREGVKRIQIVSRCDDTRWSVTVRNNGEPPTREAIDGIYERFAAYRAELGRERLDARGVGTGFGLGNTVLRLYLFYKGEETFRIGTDGEETVVEIGGPIHAK